MAICSLPATFWQAVKLLFIPCHFPSVLTKVRENRLVFPQNILPFDNVQPRAFFYKVLLSLWPHCVCTRYSGTLSLSGRVTRHLFRPETQPLNGLANKELLSKQTLFILVSALGCHHPHASPCRTGHSSPLGLGSRPPPTVFLSRPKQVISYILIDAEGCRVILRQAFGAVEPPSAWMLKLFLYLLKCM